MEGQLKRKADDELSEALAKFKRERLEYFYVEHNIIGASSRTVRNNVDFENDKKEKEKEKFVCCSSSKAIDVEEENGEMDADDAEHTRELVSCDVRLDGAVDKNTLIWLDSKHNARFFLEEYGVNLVRVGISLDNEGHAESHLDENTIRQVTLHNNMERKAESQSESLCYRISSEVSDKCCYRISSEVSDKCNREEADWFVKEAANFVRFIASSGVYVQCFWYEGPLPQGPNGMLSVSSVVKKIKGLDGRNLERIQDRTGVIIGVVINNKAVSLSQSSNANLPKRLIGVRIRCIRRRGVSEASKKIRQLLGLAGNYFQREALSEANEKSVIQPSVGQSSPIPLQSTSMKRNIRRSKQPPDISPLQPYSPFENQGGRTVEGYMRMDVPDSYAPRPPPNRKLYFDDVRDEDVLHLQARNTPNLLYVYNLPGHVPVRILKSIFHKALAENLLLASDPILHVILATDQSYAILHLANEALVKACMKLYSEDRTIFNGLKVGLPRLSFSDMDGSGGYHRLRTRSDKPRFVHDDRYLIDESFPSLQRNYEHSKYTELEPKHRKSTQWLDYEIEEEPNTLFLTELPPSSSSQSVRQLFEKVLTHYIGPPLISSSGRSLVLDVRYVPTKGCAFVDMATPELVDFMLDLHYQKPEMFDYMKMEIGNKYVSDNREENYRFDWVAPDIRPGHFLPKSRGSQDIDPLVGYGHPEGKSKKMKIPDHTLESRDHNYVDIKKHPKSDPEKTIFAYNFPADASEETVCKIIEYVVRQDGKAGLHDKIVSEVRMPSNTYCFIVFATQELARLALRLYAQDKDIFEKIHMRPHVDSQNEERFRNCF
eukprot:TRINITY_DN799_c0_g1_i7.p1 TRINITY_DN799_c0_g1~~TRINITY_DN799_c0_g1_i7.p1  ORF type:complete len:828 (-),score=138.33 TRINITY_DN799_c0_g1_i7:504-2987(-)